MMVAEYMQGGDLGTALAHDSPSARRLGWYQNGHLIALDIARGLAYLHAQKVCPRRARSKQNLKAGLLL